MAVNAVAEVDAISTALEQVAVEDVTTRHRRERKELQAKIQALKKNAPKSDKKKRKEVLEQIACLENALENRQAKELNDISLECSEKQLGSLEDDKNIGPVDIVQRVTKAQKRRDKKSREAKQLEEEIRVCQDELENSLKAVELRTINSKLKERELMLHHIPSDGDCLYNAVRHQLQQHGFGVDYTVAQLREETANYIEANKDSLICYMTNPTTGDSLNDADFKAYCEAVRNTPAWGGQIELKALSSILKIPIEVLQATGAPTMQGAAEFAGPNLLITYHRHMYSLGEHYNGTKPIERETTDDGYTVE